MFTSYFNEELYRYADSWYKNARFQRYNYMYSVVGIAKVLRAVEISNRNSVLNRDMKYFIEQDCRMIYESEDYADQIIHNFSCYFTARTDLKFMADGNFQILSVSDRKAAVSKPPWFQKGGIGYSIQSYAGKIEFVAKATVDGQIQLRLMGLDIRDSKDKSKRIPYWVDYTKLIINKKTIFDTLTPAWHDKPYFYNIEAKAGAEIKIQVEWLPHRSDT